MRDFALIAVSPAALADPSIAVAAAHAGGVGILDLTEVRGEHAASAGLRDLTRSSGGRWGVKLDPRSEPSAALAHELPTGAEVVVLVPSPAETLADLVDALHVGGREVWLETTSLEEVRLGERVGVDAFIAKGNEAGGRVGGETAFILLQRLLEETRRPVFAHGGISLHSAAACFVGGAAGVVLDAQLFLTRESRLPEHAKRAIARMDGSETVVVGERLGTTWRVYRRSGAASAALQEVAEKLANEDTDADERREAWRKTLEERVGWGPAERDVWPLGQDAAFARPLADRFGTVAGVLDGIRSSIDSNVRTARALKPFGDGAPLARSHGTKYPVVQGPMTRVSDRAAFAAAVAGNGALPFLALALMRAPDVEELLEETKGRLAERPWGVGILGFVPPDLRREQIEVIRRHRPAFALIAGGRPDQALTLEQDGIPTYLHVPSPGLLELFLEAGARRFVFEGRECGGHVGPRSSFVLWSTMVDVLLREMAPDDLPDCHVLFAGGIHDASSAAMAATIAAPLAERGARVGALLGTAYLFTEEAVATGAIVAGFQEEAVRAAGTVLVESGPGHATRCTDSPFVEVFEREKRRLIREGLSGEELRDALERFNVGRLRIASKGVIRHPRFGRDAEAPKFAAVGDAEQRAEGLYMVGQAVALRDSVTTVEELHRDVTVGSSERLDEVADPALVRERDRRRPHSCDVAIVGMACLLPQAPDVETYWRNILDKVDAITEVPEERWDWRRYFDADPSAPDKVYSRWGGFVDDVLFDPLRYGMPPKSLPSIEPLQLLTLEVVREALADAGYADRPFERERASVILGVGGGVADLGHHYALRAGLPLILDEVPRELLAALPEWTEDSFPGILLNVVAGRVANRFDLGGVNYTVDAACASSLAAVHLGVRELESGTSDLVVVGGGDTVQNAFGYLCFSKTHALSPTGRCRPFDEKADGIAISEGVAVVVLKRLEDAERDGDRIYAVVKSVAGSSDGRAKGLTAPRPEGQALALERAYEQAGFSPSTVELIEAHGTGTVAGDRAEVQTLRSVFEAAGAESERCAIGSVKSNIGHTKCTAGVAGLVKVALALHHKVVPPTINVEQPNSKAAFPESPFYVAAEARPWIHGRDDAARRAGVSAFGFGGTNFHAVVEEYTGADAMRDAPRRDWPAELLLWAAPDRQELGAALERLDEALAEGARPSLTDLAYTLSQAARDGHGPRLAIVATTLDDVREKIRSAREALEGPESRVEDARGIYFADEGLEREGKVAFLFPGQGSQHCDMLQELAIHFPEVRERFEVADRTLAGRLPKDVSTYVFPPPRFDREEERRREQALTQTNVAQPALGAAGLGVLRLLEPLGVRPDMAAGHSYGEYVALCAAGVFGEEELYALSEARGRCILDAADGADLGTMAAVSAGPGRVAELLDGVESVVVANLNSPRQTVVAGPRDAIERVIDRLARADVPARPIPVACAFHSPLVAPARDSFAALLENARFRAPAFPVYSNTTAAPHPHEPAALASLLADHLVNPVRFADEIEAMYAAGARIFVEAGPRSVLTGLTKQILGDRPALVVPVDEPGRSGLVQLQHALARLAVEGVPVELDRLYEGRRPCLLDLAALRDEGREEPPPATAWLVNGGRAKPVAGTSPPRPEPVHVRADGASAAESATPAAPGPADLAPAPASAAPTAESDAAMLAFQQLMNRFLETQEQVMLAYLRASPGAADAPAGLPPLSELSPERPSAPSPVPPTDVPSAPAPASPAAPPAPAPAIPASTDGHDGASAGADGGQPDLLAALLRIVSDRTGYPAEMLDVDLNLEADLGVDSIKRVEIVGEWQRACFPRDRRPPQEVMEKLAAAKTLRGIVDSLGTFDANGDGSAPRHGRDETPETGHPEVENRAEVPRLLVEVREAPLADASLELAGEGVFVLTNDERGVAESLQAALAERGARAVILPSDADLSRRRTATSLVERLRREHGRVRGVLHLRPLRATVAFDELDLAGWRRSLDEEVKALFQLVQAASGDLKEGGHVVATTAMGGAFGEAGDTAFSPTQGSVAGFVKTLALEWPRARTKVVDLDAGEAREALADHVLAELGASDGRVEVGHRHSRRLVLGLRTSELGNGAQPLALDSSSVILVTGGARGITAECAAELARQFRPTLILVGRSPLPDPDESPATEGLNEPAALKGAVIERLRGARGSVGTAEVEAEYARVLKDREIRSSIAALTAAGATVRYRQCDVRDEVAFGSLIDELYAEHGRIDAVVHGAGVIEDKLVEDKTADSFERVLDTKATSAFVLARKLRPESLRFLVFFSSVAGRFGNAGQADYAAANEVLSRLAAVLDRRWPARVVAIDWGPWLKTGMVSRELERRLSERGMQLIPPSAGREAFQLELRYGRKGETPVVLGAGPWTKDETTSDGAATGASVATA